MTNELLHQELVTQFDNLRASYLQEQNELRSKYQDKLHSILRQLNALHQTAQ